MRRSAILLFLWFYISRGEMSDYIIARNRYGSIEDFVFIFWIWHCRCWSKVGFLWVMEGKFLNTPFLSANWLQFFAEQSGLCTKSSSFVVKFNHECRSNLSFLANQHQVSLETHIELALSKSGRGLHLWREGFCFTEPRGAQNRAEQRWERPLYR